MKFENNMDIINITLSEDMLDKFKIYYQELTEWNKVMNLTAILEEQEVYTKHFYDSLCLNQCVALEKQTLLDVGSGAGFPSIPLKIVYPNLKITIIDSLGKRISFLQNLCNKLGINDVTLIHGRAEEYKARESFDLVTARAVANLQILSELCIPFVKIDGYFIAMKGMKAKQELDDSKNAIKKLGGKIDDVINYNVNEEFRSLIKVKKIQKTLNKYPRNYGKIKKSPL